MSIASTKRVNTYDVPFWIYTLGLVLIWLTVYATAVPGLPEAPLTTETAPSSKAKDLTFLEESPTTAAKAKNAKDENLARKFLEEDEEKRHSINCKALCEHCGCLGFYCGEECICECNNENSDTECIHTMQANARKLDIPFEILIQGPSSNRFVRNAFQYAAEPDWDALQLESSAGEENSNFRAIESSDLSSVSAQKAPIPRSKRSTVRVYRPPLQNSLDLYTNSKISYFGVPLAKLDHQKNKQSARKKRTVKHMEWFTDLTNTLVRPAPLNDLRKKSDAGNREEASLQTKRSTSEMDRSWFADNSNRLLRPAPLFRRQRLKIHRDNNNNNDGSNNNNANDDGDVNDDFVESLPRHAVEQLPRALEETFRSMRETAKNNAENGGGLISAVASDIVDGNFGERVRNRLEEGASVLQNHLAESNLDFLPPPEAVRENIQQTLSNLRSQILSKDERPLAPFLSAMRDSLSMGRQALSQAVSSPSSSSLQESSAPLPSSSSASQPAMSAPRTTRSQTRSAPLSRSAPSSSSSIPRHRFQWLRPMRFLHRVHQSIE